jgi:diguanylate cyclase (GGDEF)-like protein
MRIEPKPLADVCPPEDFVVKVSSELNESTVRERWQSVNVILRLAMMAGLRMQLDATLNLLCDFAGEIAPHEKSLTYFWSEDEQQLQLRDSRTSGSEVPEALGQSNILNVWVTKYSRPILATRGCNAQADALLDSLQAGSALGIPLFVSNRVMGSLQLFSRPGATFNRNEAQLLWMLSLVGEPLLTRDYSNEGLLRFAFTDYLTGLKTRGYFEQQLELEIKRSERKKTQFALLMIDIDLFKQLNDRHGHHAGDQVLRDVAALLMKDMREVDTVARYGGEEFVIILPETGGPGARLVAERVRRTIEHAKFFAGSPHAVERVTISLGVAIYEQDAKFRRELIENADTALYAAKSEGRNRTVLYSQLPGRERREVS